MKKIVLTFGILSGLIFVTLLTIVTPLCISGAIDFENAEVIGYTAMFFAFILVFVGIRSYRDNVAGGTVTFGKAFRVGILITLISSSMHVVAWEIYFFNFAPDFAQTYSTHVIEKERASGASAAEIAAKQEEMKNFQRLYANPFFNVGMTFVEVFPIGLVMTLISAGILRTKNTNARHGPATTAAA